MYARVYRARERPIYDMATTVTRTICSGIEHLAYVTIDNVPVVPRCISRFSAGSRIELTYQRGNTFAIRAADPSDPKRIFEPETWVKAV